MGRWVRVYYLATPGFALADAVFGANVRAVALDGEPLWRAGYYAACLACGLAAWRVPRWSAPLGMAESALNLLLLALSVMRPLLALADAASRGAALDSPFTPAFLVNLGLSAGVWLALFHGAAGGRGGAWRGDRPALS